MNQRKIASYKLLGVTSENGAVGSRLTAEVNKHIVDGWEVYGELKAVTVRENLFYLYQAVVKYAPEPEPPREIQPPGEYRQVQ